VAPPHSIIGTNSHAWQDLSDFEDIDGASEAFVPIGQTISILAGNRVLPRRGERETPGRAG
jgi:hypothetical protein